MPTPATRPAPHLSIAELKQRSDAAMDPRQRAAWTGLWLLARGYGTGQVAEIVGVARTTLLRWVERYNDLGADFVPPRSPLAGRRKEHHRGWS